MDVDEQANHKRQMRIVWILLFSTSAIAWLGFLWFRSTSYDDFCYRIGSSLMSGLFAVIGIILIVGVGIFLENFRKK